MIRQKRVARDSKEQVVWIEGNTNLSPLTYREFRYGIDMTSGTIKKSIYTFYAPFYIKEEPEDTDYIIQWKGEGIKK